jgi:hypothetical protein
MVPYLYGVVGVGIGGSPSPLTLRALLQEYLQSVVSMLALVLWWGLWRSSSGPIIGWLGDFYVCCRIGIDGVGPCGNRSTKPNRYSLQLHCGAD